MKKKELIRPDQVSACAERKEQENIRFRVFLKNHADPQLLDQQFLQLHNTIFPKYDCTQCRNCCKLLQAEILTPEISRYAELLHMTRDDFVAAYLEQGDCGEWLEKHSPCGFLESDGSCKLGECRPESCKKFPFTNQPERLSSLYSVLNAASVCPAAYEIIEALKREYHFRSF